MVNWELNSCCNNGQVTFLVTIGVFTVAILVLWRTVLLLPFKLITVFLHEASHAIACELTCGHPIILNAKVANMSFEGLSLSLPFEIAKIDLPTEAVSAKSPPPSPSPSLPNRLSRFTPSSQISGPTILILPNDGKLIEWSSSTDFRFRAFTIIICCSIPFPLPLPPLLFLYPFWVLETCALGFIKTYCCFCPMMENSFLIEWFWFSILLSLLHSTSLWRFTIFSRYWTVSYRIAPDINRWQAEAVVAFQEIIMSGVSESNVPSQSSRGTKRKWVLEEDAALVSCMVDLHNIGTFNADTGFKAGYLNELEKMLENVLPNAMLKARPNIESRIRLLKRDWSIVYDMLNGQNNSGFGWDDHRQIVVAEDAVWDSYLKSHREADRATGKDAQTAADVLEEINAEDVPAADINEERNEYYDCDANVSLDDMDVSATKPQPDRNQGGSSSSKRKKKNSDASGHFSSSVNDAATLLAENMRAIGEQISRSIASDVVVHQGIQEKAANLYPTLCEIEGLTMDERFQALSKIPDHPTQMVVFFSLPSDVRLEWVRRFLADH
ncbi:hypothetical protein GOBAR_DD19425 [Gossypium barbadense]|nr:hypothetical protein GOBAR_DD19425 [Gossypium barbadense]